jgi:hypothetical protein
VSEPVPIRRGVDPQFDTEREIIDFARTKVREFTIEQEAPPTRIVMVLVGKSSDHEQASTTHYWDTESSRTESELCGHAIALLTKRMCE